MRSPARIAKVRSALAHRQPDLAVVIENVHDPHNVSAILRSCDAVGVRRVELMYTVEKLPKIGKKSSSSANKWVERRTHRSVAECFGVLRGEGFTVAASHLGTGTLPLYDLDLRKRVALVFGNEHRGVSDEAAGAADFCFRIPMMGMIQSLNVSVAAAVALYEALRQRLAAGDLDAPKLGAPELEALYEEWIGR